jgi:broad specificity phosphatase PhoE
MRLYLVRHGQTAWNLEEIVQGHSDIELDEVGRRQAAEVARAFRGVEVERILTSDLARSLETARQISEVVNVPLETMSQLRERGFGVHEGKPYELIRTTLDREATENGHDPFEHRFLEGESLKDVWERITPVLETLQADSRKTVVVSHGGVLGLMLSRLILAGPGSARSFRFANASITELSRRGDHGWAIDRLNDKTHLEVAREGFGTGS